MSIVREPQIITRPEQPYLGIRAKTSMRGMFKVVGLLRKELLAWFQRQGIRPAGPEFLRYHVIDMAREMDIEYGIPVAAPVPGNQRVQLGVLPAGRYASLVYTGSGLNGNKTLIDWARAKGLVWDRWDDPKGDAFASRYEAYLTDPKVEPRKTRWQVEVAIKLADGSGDPPADTA